MKIAYDAKRAFANRRGLGNYSRDVIRLMTTYAPDEEYLLFARPTERYTFPGTRTIAPEGIWKACPSLWRSFGCVGQMKDVDLYWGLSGELPFGIHRTGVKTIVTIHDVIFLRYPDLYSATYRRLFTRKMQYALRVADVIVAISEQTKRDIIDFFGIDAQRIQVVYQGCNNRFRELVTETKVEETKARYNLPERYLLAVGAIEPRKNLHRLIEAIHLAKTDLPLVAVGGKNAYADRLSIEAQALGVDLRYLHDLPFSELPAVYKGAELLCYPSIFEGFGIPILEAMCVGTPVLTSTGSCFSETGGDAALYADPLNAEEIASQLTKILSEPALREEMILKGKIQADRFTDEKVAANLIRVAGIG